MSKGDEYSQGICQDGAAILKNGQMMTIEEILSELRAAHQQPPAEQESVAFLPPFAGKVIGKLRRVDECFADGQCADIGTHWFNILTKLGLLNREQRSPALWSISQQGEDVLSAKPYAAPPDQSARIAELEHALKGMIAIHDEPAGFVGKYGRALDEALDAQQVKIDKRIAVSRAALAKHGEAGK